MPEVHGITRAIAGLDVGAIGSKSLIGFGSGLTFNNQATNIIFNNKTLISFVPA